MGKRSKRLKARRRLKHERLMTYAQSMAGNSNDAAILCATSAAVAAAGADRDGSGKSLGVLIDVMRQVYERTEVVT